MLKNVSFFQNLDDNDFSEDRKSIVVTHPAKTLTCTEHSIQVTLDNGNIMTIPIEGNINVDVG